MNGIRVQLDKECSDILEECKQIYYSQDPTRETVGVSWPKLIKIVAKYYRDS